MSRRVKTLRIKVKRNKKQQRARRTAYRSGRREVVGFDGNPFKRSSKVMDKKVLGSVVSFTPFKSKTWRRY